MGGGGGEYFAVGELPFRAEVGDVHAEAEAAGWVSVSDGYWRMGWYVP